MEFRDYGGLAGPVQLFEAFLQADSSPRAGSRRQVFPGSRRAASEDEALAGVRHHVGFRHLPQRQSDQAPHVGVRRSPVAVAQLLAPVQRAGLQADQLRPAHRDGGSPPGARGREYHDSQINEIVGPSITVETFGRAFSLSRRALINDDLNQLRDRPRRSAGPRHGP